MGKKETLRAQAARLLEEAERLDSLPDDRWGDGDVLQFKREFPQRGHSHQSWAKQEYTYVAVKIGERWWCSGLRDAQLTGWCTWDQLAETLASGVVTELWEATAWEEVPLP